MKMRNIMVAFSNDNMVIDLLDKYAINENQGQGDNE